MPISKMEAFKRKIEKAAESTKVEMYFPEMGECTQTDQFEDDGTLHVAGHGLRACFDVSRGQALEGAEQNANTVKVMTALGMEKKIGDRVLVEEDEENEDVCRNCGRPMCCSRPSG